MPTTPFISEIHYDNASTDVGEFVEVQIPAGTSSAGLKVVLYNGSGGASYGTLDLPTMVAPAGSPAVVAVNGPSTGIQNGAPDGLALVRADGTAIEFLSYEGTFAGTNGAALGMTATDIGVSEPDTTPVGLSLSRAYNATTGQLFWNAPAANTRGAVNPTLEGGIVAPTGPSITAEPSDRTVYRGHGTTLSVESDGTAPLAYQWYRGAAGDTSSPVGTDDASYYTGALEETTSFWVRVTNEVGTDDSRTATVTVTPDACTTGPVDPIGGVQGSGASTPMAGGLATVRGVVVGDYEGPSPTLRGFYVQDAGDGDPATSDGIFVFNFNNDDVDLGDVVEVRGTAGENQGQTQISGNPIITLCGHDTATATDVTLPVASATELERYEGMLVRFPQQLTVTEHFQLGRSGEVVVSSGGRLPQPTAVATPGAAAQAVQAQNDLNQVTIDDATNAQNVDPIVFGRNGHPLSAENTLRGGDTVTGATGVLTYTWGGYSTSPNAYRLRPIGALGGQAQFEIGNPRPEGPPAVGGQITVASANLLNFFNTFGNSCTGGPGGESMECRGANNQAELDRQVAKTVAALSAMDADVVGYMEMENDGYGTDSAVRLLVDRLNANDGAGTWALVEAAPTGTDAIRVGLLYKPSEVRTVGAPATDAGSDIWDRIPVAQTFRTVGTDEVFTVVVNHLKSKGSCPTSGPDSDQGDGAGCWNVLRTAQAERLAAWVGTDPTGSSDSDFLLVGDFNSYDEEDPVKALEAAGFTDLVQHFHGDDAYSYAFDGQWGYLDYAFASESLVAQVTGAEDYHINADEPSILDYNMEFKSVGQLGSLYAPDEFRVSDHDPLVVGLFAPWTLDGFFAPVDMGGVANVVKGGSTVPLKWTAVDGDEPVTDVADVAAIRSQAVACDPDAPLDRIENTTDAAPGLVYDEESGQFVYRWRTPLKPGCRTITVEMVDGSSLTALFRIR
jgi:predicted extracellular nuclease